MLEAHVVAGNDARFLRSGGAVSSAPDDGIPLLHLQFISRRLNSS